MLLHFEHFMSLQHDLGFLQEVTLGPTAGAEVIPGKLTVIPGYPWVPVYNRYLIVAGTVETIGGTR